MFDLASFIFGALSGVAGFFIFLKTCVYYHNKRYERLTKEFMNALIKKADGEGITVIHLEDDDEPNDRSVH